MTAQEVKQFDVLKNNLRSIRTQSADAEAQFNIAQDRLTRLSHAREEAEHAFNEAVRVWLAQV